MRKIKVQTLGNLPMVAVMVSREAGIQWDDTWKVLHSVNTVRASPFQLHAEHLSKFCWETQKTRGE